MLWIPDLETRTFSAKKDPDQKRIRDMKICIILVISFLKVVSIVVAYTYISTENLDNVLKVYCNSILYKSFFEFLAQLVISLG